MDELDKAILRELSQGSVHNFFWPDFRSSSRAIGKRLGVPAGTVRNRIAKWRKSGLVKGAALLINPSLFNLHAGMLTLDASPSVPKRELVKRLSMLDHMLVVSTHVGNWVGTAFLYGSEESRKKKVDLISTLCGGINPLFAEIGIGPPYTGRLSYTDWRIIEGLQRNPLESHQNIAIALRISPRTVKRRVEKMTSEGAITATALSSMGAVKNEIFAWLMVVYKDRGARDEADRSVFASLGKDLWNVSLGDNYSVFLLNPPSIMSCREILERVETLAGVKAARIEIIEERVELFAPLRENVDERLAEIRSHESLVAAR